LSEDWKKIDLVKLREEHKGHEENESKHWATISATEQKIDGELKELRRLYLQGAVNLHIHKPTQEQISHDKSVLGDFKKSTQRLASCKQYLISGSSMKGANQGSSHFRSVTLIQEDAIVKMPIKSTDPTKKRDPSGLIGEGPHGTKVYSAEWLKYPVAVKHFSKPIDKERLNVLKNMESFKHLLALRGICIPKENSTGTTLVLQLCVNFDIKTVFSSGTVHFSFPRKLKWIQAICRALEWIHQRNPLIIHSRLNPRNLLLTSEWKMVVADYGLGYEEPAAEELFFVAPELLKSKKETTEADVYAFAANVWYIITERKGKYATMPWSKITESLQAKDISIFPPGMPKTLETVLFNCINAQPENRPNFFSINEEINWDTMNAASLTKNNEEASKIWTNAQNSGKVQFEDLAASYMKTDLVKNKLTPEEIAKDPSWRCLSKFFESEDKMNNFIAEQDWMKFVHFFNPIDETTLLRVHDLFSQKWYYGRLSKAKAGSIIDATLTANPKLKKVFLVRESSFTKEGNAAAGDSYTRYTVTFFDTRAMRTAEHARLPKVQTSLELIAFINEQYNPKAGWAAPDSSQRDLELCFVKGNTSLYMSSPEPTTEKNKSQDWDRESVRYVR